MSLEGSLETVALPEVLQLLSDTSKTGELLVRGDRGEGRLWFGSGRLTGFSVGRAEEPADALFDLLRTGEGRFSFEADAARPDDAHQVGAEAGDEVRPVLEVAQARFAEWTDILSVVPSLEHLVRLVEEGPADGVTLEAGQWSLVIAVGEGRSVQEVLERASLPEFDGCRSVKGLVDLGLATVSQPVRRTRSRKSTPAVPKEVVPEVADEPADSEQDHLEMQVDEMTETPAVEALVEDAESSEHAFEAPLDPGEYVFTASADEASEQPAEELAPWSVQLGEAVSDGDHGEEYVPRHVPLPEPHEDEYSNGSEDPRSALEALLAEIPADDHEAASHEEASHDEAPDGLADRGPWTSRELDQMSWWNQEDQPQQAAAASSLYDAEAHEPA
ncbi:MAG TPA: DUF4388 domain-containing protein, partial [Acidimicrobiales bacterium]|nr:DUF4388 domain-containing protein [Acidimicrobiales bacterium]